jgi:hypothetical protein
LQLGDEYSTLRAIEATDDLPFLGNAASAATGLG